jgi:hypothetical protein
MRILIAQARVQISHHLVHLFLRHLIRKRGHRSLPCSQYLLNLRVRRRLALRQCVPAEDTMQTRRNLLQVQIVLFVAVRTANVIQVLAFSLLLRQRRRRSAARHAGKSSEQKRCTNAIPISMLNLGDLGGLQSYFMPRNFSLSGRANSGQAAQRTTRNPLPFLNNVTSRPAIILNP